MIDTQNWNADRAFEYFESRTNLERLQPQLRLYRLERMEHLLASLGGPERSIPVVHIAGSKGKGSTSAYIASILAAAGHTVGMYTSPHVTGYRERFTVLPPGRTVGEPVPSSDTGAAICEGGAVYEEKLAGEALRICRVVEQMAADGTPEDDLPTTFELLTALAFLFFPAVGCDRLVLETGLGGRLDATNVCRPQVAVITRIEREHTEYLGETIPEIAGEKAGIIKEGVPVVCAAQRPEAYAVMERVSRERHAPLINVEEPPQSSGSDRHEGPWRGRVTLPRSLVYTDSPGAGDTITLRPAMVGTVQRKNILQALLVYRNLVERSLLEATAPDSIIRAIEECRLPGRGEVIEDVFLDGAHTPESVAAVVSAYVDRFGPEVSVPVILGIVAGKDVEGIARALQPLATKVIVSTPGRFKPGDPQNVAARVASEGLTVTYLPDHREALLAARDMRGGHNDGAFRGETPPILVTGSFYMVAEIRRLVVP
jgi:dihydrofolate synthase / folylpolyglutamate synthase